MRFLSSVRVISGLGNRGAARVYCSRADQGQQPDLAPTIVKSVPKCHEEAQLVHLDMFMNLTIVFGPLHTTYRLQQMHFGAPRDKVVTSTM